MLKPISSGRPRKEAFSLLIIQPEMVSPMKTEFEFLTAIKSYVEDAEETMDGEWGHCRSISQLIKDGAMPQPLYSEIVRRIEALPPMTKQHRAKPEVWAAVEKWCKDDMESFNCILELRSRVEALEAAQRPTVKPDLTVPSSSLMEQVARAISGDKNEQIKSNWWKPEARHAILATANWLDQQELHDAATRLRQEVRVG